MSLDVATFERNANREDPVMTGSLAERRSIIDAMHRVIQSQLTERQRDVLLSEVRGEPMAEIAIRVGSSRNAIHKLTHDARKRLKRGLERTGHSAATVAVAFS